MTGPVAIGSQDDAESCILVCQVVQQKALAAGLTEAYEPLPTQHGYYVPLARDVHWPTSYLLGAAEPSTKVWYANGGRQHKFSHKWYGHTVAQNRTDELYMPVVVNGPRHLTLPVAHPQLPFTGGWRDCYVAWMPLDGGPFPRGAKLGEDGELALFQAKRAAGALISRTAVFDPDGNPAGFETTAVTIELSWYLGPPDNIKIDLYGHTYRHDDESEKIKPPSFFARARPSWVDTLERAYDGFNRLCSSWPDYAETERLTFLQSRELSAEFSERIKGMDWILALDEVEDVYQLVTACQTLEPAEFAHRRTPNKRGREMVAKYSGLRPDRAAFIQELWEQARPILTQ